jgi:hypothetical protein
MNFRKLDVYQFAVRFLPVAAAIADSLPPRFAALGTSSAGHPFLFH